MEIQLRSLLAAASDESSFSTVAPPVTDIIFHFGDVQSGRDLGSEATISTQFIELIGFEEIPDYAPPEEERSKKSAIGTAQDVAWARSVIGGTPNKNYLRQQLTYRVVQSFFKPVRFWLQNRGGVGARDVHIDIDIRSNGGDVVLISKNQLPSSPPSKTEAGFGLLSARQHATTPDEVLKRSSSGWSSQMEVRALQPQREISPDPDILIGAMATCEVVMGARIYADTLAEPVYQELHLRIEVEQLKVPAREAMPGLAKE